MRIMEGRAVDRLTWQQYEGKYRSTIYAAVKAANPEWEPGQPFSPGILDKRYKGIRSD